MLSDEGDDGAQAALRARWADAGLLLLAKCPEAFLAVLNQAEILAAIVPRFEEDTIKTC